jgi:FKBP-type peptidyl-prolyl cis-trans isomerase SlyD
MIPGFSPGTYAGSPRTIIRPRPLLRPYESLYRSRLDSAFGYDGDRSAPTCAGNDLRAHDITLPETTMTEASTNAITEGKYVELTYCVRDSTTGDVLTEVSRPLNYVHGVNEILAPRITRELVGKTQGERVDLLVDCNEVYGPRDESLVITEKVSLVPREYRQVGSQILMENNQGRMKSFLVTKIEGDRITFDGNNPLCGREVIYQVKIHLVRDATAAEKEYGGNVEASPES